jgi:hypothetical protein
MHRGHWFLYSDRGKHEPACERRASARKKIQDYVELDESKAWLEFQVNGQKHHWDITLNDDWVDPQVLSKVAELLNKSGSRLRFT